MTPSNEGYLRNFITDQGEVPGEYERTPQKDTFTATAGQTVFTLTFAPNSTYPPFPYVNLIYQYNFTLVSNVITLATPCNAGDAVEVVYWT